MSDTTDTKNFSVSSVYIHDTALHFADQLCKRCMEDCDCTGEREPKCEIYKTVYNTLCKAKPYVW